MVTDIDKLVGAVTDLVGVVKENSATIKEFIEHQGEGGAPQKSKTIEDLQRDNPVTKVHEYLVQRMTKMQGRETWDNEKKFLKESEAKEYMMNTKGVFRIVIETKYLESNPNEDA